MRNRDGVVDLRWKTVLLAFVVLIAVVSPAVALGEQAPTPGSETLSDESGERFEPDTNAAAAADLPKQDLDRDQAENLLKEVFGAEMEVPAEFFDELDVEAFRSDYVALVDAPTSEGTAGLLSSTLPLRTETESGEEALVDLDLEQADGHLQPENPLVEVEIPSELGDGISLPDAGVGIALSSGSGERMGSEVGDASAFYPNVRPDTDIAITAVPTGVETYTQLRSPDAPRQEVFDLSIPSGSTLSATKDGGATVVDADGQTVISVPAPWAMDARGEQMPTDIEVEGRSISVTVHPTDNAVYPILLDPIFESYNFNGQSTPGTLGKDWSMASNYPSFGSNWGSYPNYGMTAQAWGGQATSPGFQAMFNYYVPRYWTDINNGKPKPKSYIRDMKLWNLTYMTPQETGTPAQNRPAYPFMQLSLWDETLNQMVWSKQRFGYEGQWTDGSYVFDMYNPNENPYVKHGGFALATFDSWIPFYRYVNVQQASVEVTDQDLPAWEYMLSPSGWMNQSPKQIEYETYDYGLGVYSLRVVQPQAAGGSKTVTTSNGCLGTASAACPRTTDNTSRTIAYEPQSMAQGENTLSAYSVDPVSNTSVVRTVKVKIDHTAPQLALSGNMTEQASVGTKLHEYTLSYNAGDGDDAAAAAQAPIGTQGTGTGQLERPGGMAVDSAGNIWTTDRTRGKVVKYDKNGSFVSEFGVSGSGDGQLGDLRGIAIAPNGNLWVTQAGTKAVQQFTPSGTFVSKITSSEFVGVFGVAVAADGTVWLADQEGSKTVYAYKPDGSKLFSTGNPFSGQNFVPTSIDVDRYGNAWVSAQGVNKVVEFANEGGKSKVISSFGSGGTGAGQFTTPQGIAVLESGNIAVVDDAVAPRVEIFKPDGTFLRQLGSAGSASNQFKEPRELSGGPGNLLYVSDAGNRRIARWSHADQDPQSGVTKVEVKVDGAAVNSKAPGCTTKNCAVTGSWTLNANNYSSGPHKVDVIATDAVGLTTTKTLNIETRGDLVAPGVALSGSMTEQATVGTTRTTYKLKVSATDTGSSAEWKSGVVATSIKVDGNPVDSYSAACATEGCAVTREWTMQSSEYLGSHKVQVTATDGAGRVTTKELSITINKDVTPPKITTGTEAFFTQPQNWLIQKSYGYSTSATDENASGVANFQFKIDGAVVKLAYGTCPAGSCAKTLTGEINVLNYAGGAHAAELVATDIAGNVAKKTWTINVDPEGHISASEATDTLEAVEATAPEVTEGTPVDGLVTAVVGEEGSNPALAADGTELTSVGTPTPSSIDLDPDEGFSIENSGIGVEGSPQTGTVEVQPVGLSPLAGDPQVADGSAAVIANSENGVDTVLRPAYDGLMAFHDIREASGPEQYSWQIRVGEGETVKLIDEKNAGVFWEDGTQAMLITAESAHDADGKEVNTTVAVSGSNVVTLTVHHRVAGVTYPVVAGVGYEGGFQTVHSPPLPPTEQQSPSNLESLVFYELQAGPPELVPDTEADGAVATASSASQERRRKFVRSVCGHNYQWVESVEGAEAIAEGKLRSYCGNGFDPVNHPGKGVIWRGSMRGAFLYTPGVQVRHRGATDCVRGTPGESKIRFYAMKDAYECHYGPKTSDANGGVTADAGHYLRAQAHWELGEKGKCWANQPSEECDPPGCWMWQDKAIELHLWPSGNIDPIRLINLPPDPC